jgi:hypothetical protein
MKRYFISIVAMVAVLCLSFALPLETFARMGPDRSQIISGPIEIPLDKMTSGKEGELRTLSIRNVPSGSYEVKVESIAQPSTRSGSDIILKSGNSEVTVRDVESESFIEETSEDVLVVAGSSVRAYVRLGPDGVYSGGLRALLTPEVSAVGFPDEFNSVPGTFVQPGDLPKTGGIMTGGAVGLSALSYLVFRRLNTSSLRNNQETSKARWSALVTAPFIVKKYLVSKTPLTKLHKTVQSLLNATR